MADSADPTLYLYTSLTAGSSHIITATSRLETILKANKIPFRAIDCATDEKARMLWGRRSRGRKLPGLVRFGFVVGDLDQIEEWNEFGELKDQIKATDDSSSGAKATTTTPAHPTTINTAGTLHPEPPVTSPPIPSNPSSRASSQGRHISISEPSAKEKERDNTTTSNKPQTPQAPTSEPKPTLQSPTTETPQNLLLRQLGNEAAAKAKDRKTYATKAAAVPTTTPATSTAQTPTPASTKTSADAQPPSADPEITAGKTPALLAAEGKSKTSTDKIETIAASSAATSAPGVGEDTDSSTTSGTAEKSVEEKLLELRRSSTQTKQPSTLSVDTPVEKSEEVLPEKEVEEEERKKDAEDVEEEKVEKLTSEQEAQHVGLPAKSEPTQSDPPAPTSTTSTSTSNPAPPVPSSPALPPHPERKRSHRGSSLEEVDKETIRKAEEAIRIQEEEEGDQDEGPDDRKAIDPSVEGVEVVEPTEKLPSKSTVSTGKDVGSDDMKETTRKAEEAIAVQGEDEDDVEFGDDRKMVDPSVEGVERLETETPPDPKTVPPKKEETSDEEKDNMRKAEEVDRDLHIPSDD